MQETRRGMTEDNCDQELAGNPTSLMEIYTDASHCGTQDGDSSGN